MSGFVGHVAFIAPHLAAQTGHPHQLGAHVLESGGTWSPYYGAAVDQVLQTRRGVDLVITQLRAKFRGGAKDE
jgi:hypothetical protein